MSGLMTGFHPSFDALSAHADRTDVEAARTRVARHVARCEQCRAEVQEIRALGDAARAVRSPGAPAWLRARIESAAPRPEQPIRTSPAVPPTDRKMPLRRRVTGIAAGLLLVATTSVVLWPRPSLQAAGPSRLTFAPARPAAGGRLTIRYLPAPGLASADRLVLVGRYARPAGSNAHPFAGRGDELADSLAVLTRAADGAFVATLTLPSNFLALDLGVMDPVRDVYDVDGRAPWLVVAGTATGAPSLDALLAAHDAHHDVFAPWVGTEQMRSRQAADLADSLKRYFPRHPSGWAFTRSYGLTRGRFDLLRFFESAERKYASLFEQLWPSTRLDAERLHDMVEFAYNISEPGEALRWAGRLVDEHPEDPRALIDLAGALHELELRSPPALADSMRAWLPALDRTYRAAPVPNVGFDAALRIAGTYGDSATKTLWAGRARANGEVGNVWTLVRRASRLEREDPERELRVRAGRGCVLPAGRLPLGQAVADWTSRCELYRSLAYGYLSSATLTNGSPRAALAEADSAIGAMRRAGFCGPMRAYLAHALASLALGDTATAARDFIAGSAGSPAGATAMLDTARAHLGARLDEAAFHAGADSARRAQLVCETAARERRRARQPASAGE